MTASSWQRLPFAGYLHPKLIAVLLLGFSSGLPILLIGGTMGLWLFEAGLDIKNIGIFGLVSLPYSFNFVWAPIIDHVRIPVLTRLLGRRRSWMLVSQIALACMLMLMAGLDPAGAPMMVAYVAVAVAFCSATQDVVIDAFRTEYLAKEQYGEGAAMAVYGYRIGMYMAGAGALFIAEQSNWHLVYTIMAALMAVGMLTVFFVSEPPQPENAEKPAGDGIKAWLVMAMVMPFKDFMARHHFAVLILVFIVFYKMPDGFIALYTKVFFRDLGFDKMEIAEIVSTYGMVATFVGMFIGGWLIHRLGITRCLFYFLILQIFTNLAFAVFGMIGKNLIVLMVVNSLDSMSGGMIGAVAVAYMMSLCNIQYTATQYALLSSLVALSSKTIASYGGYVVEVFGWEAMFVLSALLGLPAVALLFVMQKTGTLAPAKT